MTRERSFPPNYFLRAAPFPRKGTGSFLKDVDKLVVCLFAAKGGIEKQRGDWMSERKIPLLLIIMMIIIIGLNIWRISVVKRR